MSKVCEICGKAPVAGRSISHSHRVTNRMFRPNIQRQSLQEERMHQVHEGWQGYPRIVFTMSRKPAYAGFFVFI